MWQLNIPSALQLISHPTRSVARSLLCVCVFICTVGVMGVPPSHIPEAVPHPLHPHTAVLVLVQVCVWCGGNLNQMRWCLSACGPVTSSISKRRRDGGMRRWMDGWWRREGESIVSQKSKWKNPSFYLKMFNFANILMLPWQSRSDPAEETFRRKKRNNTCETERRKDREIVKILFLLQGNNIWVPTKKKKKSLTIYCFGLLLLLRSVNWTKCPISDVFYTALFGGIIFIFHKDFLGFKSCCSHEKTLFETVNLCAYGTYPQLHLE